MQETESASFNLEILSTLDGAECFLIKQSLLFQENKATVNTRMANF